MDEESKRKATESRQFKGVENLRNALKDKNLAICVGSGVTIYSTALEDKTPLARMTWRGLIEDGIYFLEDHNKGKEPSFAFKRSKSDLEDPTMPVKHLITIASMLKDEMKPRSGLFGTWMESVFGNLKDEVRHPAILNSLKRLSEEGVMLLTTNYDDLIEKACNLPAIDMSNPDDVNLFNQKRQKGVLHAHGYWRHSKTVVLDALDYYKVRNLDDMQQALRNILRGKVVLFVGCGGGLDDPNMGELLRWVGKSQENIGYSHYILLRKSDNNPVPDLPLIPLYCEDFDEIGPWLEKLLFEGRAQPEGTLYQISEKSERRLIHSWLAPLDQVKFLADNCTLETQGSSDWFLERDRDFDAWRRQGSSLMWMCGEDGSGKTVLCSSIIDFIQKHCRPPEAGRTRDSLAYYFCNTFDVYDREVSACHGDFHDFLATVITHLCPPSHVFPALRMLYLECTKHHPAKRATNHQLRKVAIGILQQLSGISEPSFGALEGSAIQKTSRVANLGETFLIIDALDKIPPNKRHDFIFFIQDLARRKLQHLHILVVSSEQKVFEASLAKSGEWIKIKLDREIMNSAIMIHVLNAVNSDPQLEDLSAELKSAIVQSLIEQPGGTFRWVSEQIQQIRQLDKYDRSEITKFLPLLPPAQKTTQPGRNELFDTSTEPGDESLGRASNTWMASYDKFLVDWIDPLYDDHNSETTDMGKLKIGLLDTGFDASHPGIQGGLDRIKDVRNWASPESNDMDDVDGHGTYSLGLILRLAPEAYIFAARVAIDRQGLRPHTVAQAISWAVRDCKVDFLVLPFTFPDGVFELRAAVDEAFYQGVIIFAATSQDGKNIPLGYPAQDKAVIGVYSSDSNGLLSVFNPSRGMFDRSFATLGEAVESAWPRKLSRNTGLTKILSGTSVSTVILAATSATLLAYAKRKLSTHEELKNHLRSHRGIVRLLELVSSQSNELLYVAPWLLFAPNPRLDDENRVNSKILNAFAGL